MSDYSKIASTLFCPFRLLNDIKIDGSYLLFFQKQVIDNLVNKDHQTILKNAQDCRNSFNAGRPKDCLQRDTNKPIDKTK